MRVNNSLIYSGTSITGTTFTDTVNLDHIYGYSLHLKHNLASASGVFTLQASNDDAASWCTVSSLNVASSGTTLVNMPDAMYEKFRGQLTVNSGTISSLNIYLYTKGA